MGRPSAIASQDGVMARFASLGSASAWKCSLRQVYVSACVKFSTTKKWILAQYEKVGVRNAELEALGYRKTAVSVKYLQLALSRNDRHSAKNSWIRIVIRISTEI